MLALKRKSEPAPTSTQQEQAVEEEEAVNVPGTMTNKPFCKIIEASDFLNH